MKSIAKTVSQILLLSLGYIIIGIIAGKLSGSDKLFVFTHEEQLAAGKALLLVSLCFSSILLFVANRSVVNGKSYLV